MATFTITVPDAALPRIAEAYGTTVPVDPANPTGPTKRVNATASQVMDQLKAVIRSKVVDYETTKAAEADRLARTADVGTW